MLVHSTHTLSAMQEIVIGSLVQGSLRFNFDTTVNTRSQSVCCAKSPLVGEILALLESISVAQDLGNRNLS